MKTLVICNNCIIKGEPAYSEVEIEDSGIYEFTCPKGHKNISILQLHSFQLLYDLGIMALLDGYTREAVSSFAASLERFQEYCIDFFLHDLSEEHKTQTWKLVARQSERQTGAFYYLYLSKLRRVPPSIGNSWVAFRNSVIHKGEIPKSEKTLQYAEYIYDYIREILIQLKETQPQHDGSVFYAYLNKRMSQYKNVQKSSMSGPTFIEIGLPIKDLKDRDFNVGLTYFKAKRENDLEQGQKRLF